MRFSVYRVLIAVALILQLAWCTIPDTNRLNDSYRYQERLEAMRIWGKGETPETKALLHRELHLLAVHRARRGFLIGACFLIVDATALYFFWKWGRKRRMVAA